MIGNSFLGQNRHIGQVMGDYLGGVFRDVD